MKLFVGALVLSSLFFTSCQSILKVAGFSNPESTTGRSVSSAPDVEAGDISESPLEGSEQANHSYPRYVVRDGNNDGWWGCFPATREGHILQTRDGKPVHYSHCVKKYISRDGNNDGVYSCFPATEDGQIIATPNLTPVSYRNCVDKYEAHDGEDADEIYTCYAKDAEGHTLATPENNTVYYSNCFGKYVARDGNNDGVYSCFPATQEGNLLSGTAVHFSHCQ